MPRHKSSHKSGAGTINVAAICRKNQILDRNVTLSDVKRALVANLLSNEQIIQLLSGDVLRLTDTRTQELMSRALIEALTIALPMRVFEQYSSVVHDECMAAFPLDGELSSSQARCYREGLLEQRAENPIFDLMYFILTSINTKFGGLVKSCHYGAGREPLHKVAGYSEILERFVKQIIFLLKDALDAEMAALLKDWPIICGPSAYFCGHRFIRLGIPFQLVDFISGENGHCVLLTGLPIKYEDKMKALTTGKDVNNIIVMNCYRREVLRGRQASDYIRALLLGTKVTCKVDATIPSFEKICHARDELTALYEEALRALYQGNDAIRSFVLDRVASFLRQKPVMHVHVSSNFYPPMHTVVEKQRIMQNQGHDYFQPGLARKVHALGASSDKTPPKLHLPQDKGSVLPAGLFRISQTVPREGAKKRQADVTDSDNDSMELVNDRVVPITEESGSFYLTSFLLMPSVILSLMFFYLMLMPRNPEDSDVMLCQQTFN